MPSAVYDIVIEQGSQFQLSFTWEDKDGDPINLTGYSARMQVRESKGAGATLVSLTSGGGDITLGGALGTVIAIIDADVTAALDFDLGFYDLELLDGESEAAAVRVLEGTVRFTKEVTHA